MVEHNKFTLLMVLHAHQPVGNFDHVFAYAVERCYRPVLEMLAEYPGFKCGLHYSGPLLSWLETHDQALLESIAQLCAQGQVEMLSGGYYEPLLAVIPQRDAVAQVDMMTAYTRERFGQEPSGFWLAERIWEPGLPAKLTACDLKYTLVDDTHLYYAGLGPRAMFGYHMTEREGHPLALFPTHKDLRYSIPFKEPQVTLDFLRRSLDEMGPACVTYGDDTEKFGLWPDTHEWVFEKGWLRRFIETVLKAGNWLTTGHPADYLQNHPPTGRVYLPTASYEEMLTWALPPDSSLDLERLIKKLEAEGRYEEMRRFLRGGLWDNFLVKYRESNLMHKRMLFVSDKLHETQAGSAARDHLYQAQCNCAYWHGLFGGLYLGHLRAAVHEHLIAAEDLCDRELLGEKGWAACLGQDVDLDGHEEVVMANPWLDALLHPAYGGSLSVLNLRPQRFNLALALTRRPEAYHAHFQEQDEGDSADDQPKSIHDLVVFKEENLEKYLIYDWYQRSVFQDHLMPPETELASFADAGYHEWGDFVDQPFKVLSQDAQDDRAWVRLHRQGNIWAPEGPWPLSLHKDFELGPGPGLKVSYLLEAPGDDTPGLLFGVELNFSFLSAEDLGKRVEIKDGPVLSLDQPQEAAKVEELSLVNRTDGFEVNLILSQPARVWCFPVETVSQSESGLERTYQGSSLSLIWDLPGGGFKREVTIELQVKSL